MPAYAIKTTDREIELAYTDLERLIKTGQGVKAVNQALGLAEDNHEKLWAFVRRYSTAHVSYKQTSVLLVIKALWDLWVLDSDRLFIVQAILTLVEANPKSDSTVDFCRLYLKH